jgi:catechol 2,3-dioxygenase-like lactoylglutathione lyase family enzyme
VTDSPQVNLYVEDVEASTRFYRESFGFTETFRTPQHGRLSTLNCASAGSR